MAPSMGPGMNMNPNPMGMAPSMGPGMGPGMYFNPNAQADEKRLVKLTRTDFLIQFVWQPPKPEELKPEELAKKVEEVTKLLTDAQKNNAVVMIPKEQAIEAASLQQSKEVENALNKAAAPPAPMTRGAPGAAPPGAAPAAGPAAPAK